MKVGRWAAVLLLTAGALASAINPLSMKPMRLRGGTGQGGPSGGFRSKRGSFRWRHPQTMSLRAMTKPVGVKPQMLLKDPTPWYKNERLRPCAPQTPKHIRDKRLKNPDMINFINNKKGRKDLNKALEDEAFWMGFTGDVKIPEEMLDYSWKDNMKLPREFKVGRWGFGKPAYDFTNRYIGGPRQA